jgi:hypothetical protein
MADAGSGTSWVQIAAVTITGVFALCGVVLSQHLSHLNQRRATRLANQQKAYATIRGLRQLMIQSLVSVMQARIDFDYFNRSWNRSGRPEDSWQFKQALRCEERTATMTIELARVRQALAEAVGQVQANFPHTTRLSVACENLYTAPGIDYRPPASDDEPVLSVWRDTAVEQVRQMVDHEYGQRFGVLLDELRQLLPPVERG